MHYYEVAPNQIVRQTSHAYTYSSEAPLAVGQLVSIEVGKKHLVGVVLEAVAKPAYATKPISAVIEARPLPAPLVALALWLADYYGTHLATVLQTVLPRGLTKTRRTRQTTARPGVRERTTIVLTPDQRTALDTIETMSPGSALLHGVTGSGKTAVYIELARQALARGQSVIVLVPEIALTSQLVDEFAGHFDDIILTHSRQTEAERHLAWRTALTSETPRIVIGPRSALFLPVPALGLIVIDEAHEPSFKQEQSPRYSALRAASILAGASKAKLVLGSATPAIADYYLAEHAGRPIIRMSTPARQATAPEVTLVDMTKRPNFTQHRFLSTSLLAALRQTFDQGHQALIFHNRRGSASLTLCMNCGWQATCPRCFVPLTLHADLHHLRCHTCGLTERVPTSCPECSDVDILHKGIGTNLIERELSALFPDRTIGRFDGDTQTGESVDARYADLYSGAIDLIIGTQVIAKGLDLPHLRTVGVIQADAGLSLPDFGASERTFQLLAQVVGRVGRSEHATQVIVQSYQPGHDAVVYGLAQDYDQFYRRELARRQQAKFPPFVFLLKLVCSYKTEAAAIRNAQQLAAALRAELPASVTLLGPAPAFYERTGDSYRWQLTLKSPRRSDLVAALQHVPPTHWQAELDPISLL